MAGAIVSLLWMLTWLVQYMLYMVPSPVSSIVVCFNFQRTRSPITPLASLCFGGHSQWWSIVVIVCFRPTYNGKLNDMSIHWLPEEMSARNQQLCTCHIFSLCGLAASTSGITLVGFESCGVTFVRFTWCAMYIACCTYYTQISIVW